MSASQKPLEGVKIIDFSIYVAAPAASSLLGYMGADVIKVEPVKGDPYRITGLAFGMPAEEELNPLFDSCNYNKRCIALNLRSDEGKAVLNRLIVQADMFVTNYRENALVAMGLTYEDLIAINPNIIYGKADGYGEKGKDTARAGFDATAFYARSGFARCGAYSSSPPMTTPSASGDSVTALSLAVGLLGAYINARAGCGGDKVISSLYTSALWTLASPIARAQYDGMRESSWTNPGMLAINHDYRCADDVWVRFCGMSAERYWEPISRALGLEGYVDDPRFAASDAQREHNAECFELMRARIETKTYAEWEPYFIKYDVPFEKIYTVFESYNDEQALVNDYVEKITYPDDKEVVLPMPPFKFARAMTEKKDRGPYLGEHTRQILSEAGYSAEEIKKMFLEGSAAQRGEAY